MILNSPYISGSLTVTGNTNLIGALTVTGSLAGTATSSSFAFTASSAVSAYTAASAVNATTALTASYATSFTVGGSLTAQTLVVQTITSSVSFVTGSTRFGSSLANTHQFTGSLQVTGSNHTIFGNVGIGITGSNAFGLDVNGTARVSGVAAFLNRVQVTGNAGPASGAGLELYYNGTAAGTVGYSRSTATYIPNSMDGSILQFYINSTERMRIAAGGNVGIGITDPSALLHISGSGSGSLMRISSHASSNIFFVSGSGNVGIGTTNPSQLLNVFSPASSNQSYLIMAQTSGAAALFTARTPSNSTYLGTENSTAGSSINGTLPSASFLANQSATALQLGTNNNIRLTIDSIGNVGIGTNSPQQKLHVEGDVYLANNRNLYFGNSGVAAGAIRFYNSTSSTTKSIIGSYLNIADEGNIEFANGASLTTKMVITSGGNVGIGTTNPTYQLQVSSASGGLISLNSTVTNTFRGIVFQNNAASDSTEYAYIKYNATSGEMRYYANPAAFGGYTTFYSNNTESMRITSAGIVCVAGTSQLGSTTLSVFGSIAARNAGVDATFAEAFTAYYSANNTESNAISTAVSSAAGQSGFRFDVSNGAGSAARTASMYIYRTSVSIVGALSKGSGTFKIDHPLESKKDTHHLVHSFIEGPRVDLIYRGKATLVDGAATINIDESAGMTEGTFAALNRDVQCFTTNESGWDLVKGKVEGNILTIISNNSNSTDEISWMVIGERQDKHIKDTDWTDENGKPILEPLKTI
jgi:hypothetical protein